MKGDLGKSFDRLIKQTFVIHRGFRATREPAGLLYNNQYYPTIADFEKAVDNYIREGAGIIGNSLNRKNK